jgi:hypothetical protein
MIFFVGVTYLNSYFMPMESALGSISTKEDHDFKDLYNARTAETILPDLARAERERTSEFIMTKVCMSTEKEQRDWKGRIHVRSKSTSLRGLPRAFRNFIDA